MRTGTLTRIETGDEGTFGDLVLDSGWGCVTGELPWRNNLPGISCIPTGTYTAIPYNSQRHGPCYLLQNVPQRTDVEIHAANWMGDKSLGYKCELLGCIALGKSHGALAGQAAILRSQEAMHDFLTEMGMDTLTITIKGVTV